MAAISLSHIYKRYGDENDTISDFNLSIHDKEFIVFVGPSGCGKSTILRMIAGLEEISGGELHMNGKFMNNVEPKDRGVAMVFQNYALYPHLTVYENIAFGLKIRKTPKAELDERVRETAELLGLTPFIKRKPKDLSGGQRQRVALGRAIARNSDIYLMDEPLSNLDAKLRLQMRKEIVKLHRTLNATTIYVTHDQAEAMTMASRIVVMKDGIVQQIGSPKEVYDTPKNIFVAEFIGSPMMNFFNAQYTDEKIIASNGEVVYSGKLNLANNSKLICGLRPESIHIEEGGYDFNINLIELLGSEYHLSGSWNGIELNLKIAAEVSLENKSSLPIKISAGKLHLFDSSSTELIITV